MALALGLVDVACPDSTSLPALGPAVGAVIDRFGKNSDGEAPCAPIGVVMPHEMMTPATRWQGFAAPAFPTHTNHVLGTTWIPRIFDSAPAPCATNAFSNSRY